MKPYNRHYYIRDDTMVKGGENACYEHDILDCKKCPTCKDELLCEGCEMELSKHTLKKALSCLKYVGILYKNNESIVSGVGTFIAHSHIYDKLVIKQSLRNPGEPKEYSIAERVNIPGKIDT